MISEKSCGAVVFTRMDDEIRYVLIRQRSGMFGFPKGHVEGNETEKETALREIREETGLTPRLIEGFRETEEYVLNSAEGVRKTVVYFLAGFSGQDIVIQPEELSGASLVCCEEAMKLLQFEGKRRILRAAHDFLMSCEAVQ